MKFADFMRKKFKKGMDEAIRMVLIIVKKEADQTFQILINLIVVVSILIFILLSKFLFPYSMT